MAAQRVAKVIAEAEQRGRPVSDTVILDFAQRCAPEISVAGVKGGSYDIAFDSPARLKTGDLLLLDDGQLLEVVAAPESLIEVRAADLAELARFAWQLGDRHVPVQILSNRLRVRCADGIEALLGALGAKMTIIDAPFDPEGGAYASAHAHHEHHGHDHAHGHGH